MRYNPATDRARYTLDEIAAQCRAAILRADEERQEHVRQMEAIADLLFDERICWEDDLLIAA